MKFDRCIQILISYKNLSHISLLFKISLYLVLCMPAELANSLNLAAVSGLMTSFMVSGGRSLDMKAALLNSGVV